MKLADWIGFLCFLIALIILWQFREFLLLLFTGVVLAIALNSLVRWIQRFGLARGKAVLVALWLVFLGGVVFISLVLPPFLTQFEELLQLVPVGYQQLTVWINRLAEQPPAWFPEFELNLPNVSQLAQQVGPLARNVLGNFFTFFSNSIGLLLQGLLVIVFTLMILAEPLSYRQVFIRLFPSFYRQRADEILIKCEAALIHWMRGIVITSLFITISSAIGLLILGVPFVFAHALLAGMFNFVPNIGPTISLVFPVSVALLDSPAKALAVIALYLIIQNLESYWVSPLIMQKQVSLLPAVTLTSQIFFATFFGFLGLVLALPLTVVAKTWIEEALMKDILDQWNRKTILVTEPIESLESTQPIEQASE